MRPNQWLSLCCALACAPGDGDPSDSGDSSGVDDTGGGSDHTGDSGDSGDGGDSGWAVAGATWVIDRNSGTVADPEYIGSLLGSVLRGGILLGIERVDGPTLTLLGADAYPDDETQAACSLTTALPAATVSDDGSFTAGPGDVLTALPTSNPPFTDQISIQSLLLSGVAAADGSELIDTSMEGFLDTRSCAHIQDLADLAGCDGTDDQCFCNFIAGTGFDSCESCPDGSGTFCLRIQWEGFSARHVDLSLVEVSADDISADPECGH